ncbi:MAG TPA: glutathione S-transferase family protein [Advenella sp.]|nr:glutathione S-transferase family protein [Advenella sp.]
MIRLYELCASDPDLVFSPYCWRVRLALAHKRLPFEASPIGFMDKEKIAFADSQLVPVLTDGDMVIKESLDILAYLDRTYPQAPLGLDSDTGRARVRFISELILRHITPVIFKPSLMAIYEAQPEAAKGYFRESREKRFGCTLEQLQASASASDAHKALGALEAQLKTTPYLDGSQPGATDFVVVAHLIFSWIFGFQYWQDDSAVGQWFNRVLNAYEEVAGPVKRRIHPAAAQYSPR